MSMSKSVSNSLILLFACIGCFVTLVLFYEHVRPAADIGCSAVGGNCAAANESIYGHVGPIPTSIFGLAMYVAIVGICLKRRGLLAFYQRPGNDSPPVFNHDDNDDITAADSPTNDPYPTQLVSSRKLIKTLEIIVWVVAASAVCISWWLQYVSLYILTSFCPWCMGSAFLVTLIFVLASKDLFLDYAKIGGEQRLLAGTVTFILIMALLMEMPDIMAHMRLAQIRVTANINGPVTQPADAPPIITPDMESTGPADAKYTIVEFADYQCPHCKKSSVMINEELKKNPNRFRFAFRNYPLPSHKWSSQAACAAEAAGEQGKFWQMHDYIFEHQADMNMQGFSEDVFTKYAEALGIKSDKFEADAASDKIMTRVANDSTTAQRVKVAMTPSFFIVNRKGGLYQITGMEKMKAALDDPTSDAWK